MTISAESLRDLSVAALEELKAIDVKVMDVRELTGVTDYMVIAAGASDRQVRALSDNVQKCVKAQGIKPLGIEGDDDAEWLLVDLGDVVVHLMSPTTRELYQLEKLWERPARMRTRAQETPVAG